jgi:hypothetical protein
MMQAESVVLPEGWTRHGLGGQVFFYHQATNTTSVELPAINRADSQENQHHPVGLDNFVMPAPNAMQAVAPRTEPLLPTAVASVDPADDRASKRGWFLYILSLACCCFCHGIAFVFSPVVWVVTGCKYWKKTPQERERFPKQRTVALTSLTTCLCASCCVCLVIAVGIGFGAGFILATQSKIATDLEVVAERCAHVTFYEKSACPDGFLSCERLPTQSERNSMCADVSNGTCEAAVKERDVKDVFDLLCDDRKWAHIQSHGRHHMHHGHHGRHWHYNPAILYVSKNRALQYMKKWCPKHGEHHGKHHDDSNGENYDYYYYNDEHHDADEWGKVKEAREEFPKRSRWDPKRFPIIKDAHTIWIHDGKKSVFQV